MKNDSMFPGMRPTAKSTAISGRNTPRPKRRRGRGSPRPAAPATPPAGNQYHATSGAWDPGRLSIALHAEREAHTAGNNWFMEFLVRDIDAVVAELARRGVSVGPVREEDFGRVTSFRDPEGNEIGLEEPRRSKR